MATTRMFMVLSIYRSRQWSRQGRHGLPSSVVTSQAIFSLCRLAALRTLQQTEQAIGRAMTTSAPSHARSSNGSSRQTTRGRSAPTSPPASEGALSGHPRTPDPSPPSSVAPGPWPLAGEQGRTFASWSRRRLSSDQAICKHVPATSATDPPDQETRATSAQRTRPPQPRVALAQDARRRRQARARNAGATGLTLAREPSPAEAPGPTGPTRTT